MRVLSLIELSAESRHRLLKTRVEVRRRRAAPTPWPKLEAP